MKATLYNLTMAIAITLFVFIAGFLSIEFVNTNPSQALNAFLVLLFVIITTIVYKKLQAYDRARLEAAEMEQIIDVLKNLGDKKSGAKVKITRTVLHDSEAPKRGRGRPKGSKNKV